MDPASRVPPGGRSPVQARVTGVFYWTSDSEGLRHCHVEPGGFPQLGAAGGRWADAVHPDDRGLWQSTVRDALAGERSFRLRYRLEAEDGSYRWILERADPVFDARGFVGHSGVCTDISEVVEELTSGSAEPASPPAEDELPGSPAMNRAIIDSATSAIVTIDETGTIRDFNSGAEATFGYRAQDVLGRPLSMLMPAPYRDEHHRYLRRYLETGEARVMGIEREVTGLRSNGETFPLELTVSEIPSEGSTRMFVGIARDVSARKAEEQRLLAAVRRFELAFERAPTGVALLDGSVDGAGRFLQANEALCAMLGLLRDEIEGRDFFELVHPEDAELSRTLFTRLCEERIDTYELEQRLLAARGEVWAHVTGSVLTGPGEPHRYAVLQVLDVTDHKLAADELTRRALHDPLTGLANRELLTDRLQHALDRMQRHGGTLAVLFLDLDGFKVVNDGLGHHVGDELLVRVAERLRGAVRPEDTVARFGGDEFVILCEAIADASTAQAVAQRVLSDLSRPLRIGPNECVLEASIGIAIADDPEDSPLALLRDADTAMYHAKGRRSGSHTVYQSALRSYAKERLTVESDLREALESGRFLLQYQPIVHVETNRVESVEALVRMRRSDGSVVGPAEFLDVAEATALIHRIGRWTMHEACHQLALWSDAGVTVPHVAVNVSAVQLSHSGVVDQLGDILAQEELAPHRLHVELTETALLHASRRVVERVQQLRDLGVRFGLDDFGTGYASLTHLKDLPVDFLKIDARFVAGLGRDVHDSAIVESVVRLARSLGLRTVAEGVETETQRRHLADLGCELVQGFAVAEPLDPGGVARFAGRYHPGGASRPSAVS